MSQPPPDQQRYPWGPPEPTGASAAPPVPSPASQTQSQSPSPSYGQPPQDDPYGGGQYRGQWTQEAQQEFRQPGQQGYGVQPYTGYSPGSAGGGEHGHQPTSPIVLMIVSGVMLLVTFWTVLGLGFVAPIALAGVALQRHRTDLRSSRHLTKIGWIVVAVLAGLELIGIIGLISWAVSMDRSGGFSDTTLAT